VQSSCGTFSSPFPYQMFVETLHVRPRICLALCLELLSICLHWSSFDACATLEITLVVIRTDLWFRYTIQMDKVYVMVTRRLRVKFVATSRVGDGCNLTAHGERRRGSRGCFSHQLSYSIFPLPPSLFPSPTIDFLARLIRISWVRYLYHSALSVALVRVAENIKSIQSVSFLSSALVQES